MTEQAKFRLQVTGLIALVVGLVIALVGVSAYALATKAEAATSGNEPNTGRYVLTNDATTKITTIKVRNADCLNAEDSAGTLKMVQTDAGYDPANGSAIYRCINPLTPPHQPRPLPLVGADARSRSTP